jgi:hypothetical protein
LCECCERVYVNYTWQVVNGFHRGPSRPLTCWKIKSSQECSLSVRLIWRIVHGQWQGHFFGIYRCCIWCYDLLQTYLFFGVYPHVKCCNVNFDLR